MKSKKKKHVYKTSIYYEDTDAGGIVYHTSYLRFAERARTEFLRSVHPSFLTSLRDGENFFVLRQLEVKFLKPSYLFDEITVETKILMIQKTYLKLNQLIKKNGSEICDINLDLVWIGKNKKLPTKINEDLISRFKKNYIV